MSVRGKRQTAIPAQPTGGERAPVATEKQTRVLPPTLDDILGMIRRAETSPQVDSQEIRAATDQHEHEAGELVTATAFRGLWLAVLEKTPAASDTAAIVRTHTLTRFLNPPPGGTTGETDTFPALLDVAKEVGAKLNDANVDILDLYDDTDDHPFADTIPGPKTYGDRDPRRTTILRAGHLIRFAISMAQAIPEEQTAPDTQAA